MSAGKDAIGRIGETALRPAALADVPLFETWDRAPHVIAAVTDDPESSTAFADISWADEIAGASPVSAYYVAEVSGRPVGAMQIIDPRLEPTHYWGEIEAGLRALDIWIGEADALGRGYGEQMMRIALGFCFAEPSVSAVVIDPLASNLRAHRFYRRLGFRALERRRLGTDADDCLVHRLERADWRSRFPEG